MATAADSVFSRPAFDRGARDKQRLVASEDFDEMVTDTVLLVQKAHIAAAFFVLTASHLEILHLARICVRDRTTPNDERAVARLCITDEWLALRGKQLRRCLRRHWRVCGIQQHAVSGKLYRFADGGAQCEEREARSQQTVRPRSSHRQTTAQ